MESNEDKIKDFIKQHEDTHIGLQISDALHHSNKGTLIREDGNKVVKQFNKVKKVAERHGFEKRASDLRHCLLDAVQIKVEAGELMAMPLDKVLHHTAKFMPTKLDVSGKIEHVTFLDIANQCSAFDEANEVEDAEVTQVVEPE